MRRESPRQVNAPAVLIVARDPVFALDVAREVEGQGMPCAGTPSSGSEAGAALHRARPGFVILNTDIGLSPAEGLARDLRRLGVPFLYVTGRSACDLAQRMPAAPVLEKPVTGSDLAETVKASLTGGGARRPLLRPIPSRGPEGVQCDYLPAWAPRRQSCVRCAWSAEAPAL